MNDINEIWKPVRDYEGLYEASNLGHIKSIKRKGRKQERILSPRINNGYLTIQLSKEGIVKEFKVHRLIYEAFYGKISEGLQVNHIDENKLNNALDNIEIVTPSENINYGTRNQKASAAISKAILCFDKQGNFIKEYSSLSEASKQLDIPISNISKCLNGYRYTAHGYIWKYKAALN